MLPLRWLGCAALAVSLFSGTGQAQVRLNEVMADNGGAVTAPGGTTPDYVEIYNAGGSVVDLGNWKITDGPAATFSNAWVFPAGTSLAAGAHLVIWLDAQTNGPGPGLHATSFSLSASGESVGLYDAANQQQDRVAFGFQVAGKPLSRIPNGSGVWSLGSPTPGVANVAVALGTQFGLRLNEWLPTNSAGVDRDRLELYNPGTNGPVMLGGPAGVQITGSLVTPDTNTALIVSNSFIDSGAFLRFSCDKKNVVPGEAADHLDFRLSSTSGETLSIFRADRTTLIDRVSFGTFTNLPLQGRDISMGRFPDGGTNIVFFYTNRTTLGAANVSTEKITNVVVSEVLTHTDPPLEDALELYNPTENSVNIGGWWISNSPDNPYKFKIPAGTVLTDGGYKVFFEQNYQNPTTNAAGFNSAGTDIAPYFTFNSAHGDDVIITTFGPSPLLNGSNTVFQLRHDFEAAANGVSFGRYVKSDGGTDLVPMTTRSFGVNNPATLSQFRTSSGGLNPYPRVGPLVISEIMYHPPNIGTNDNVLDEYVELTSITNGPLKLYDPAYPTNTWSVAGGVTYTFPTNLTLPALGRLLLVNFDPVTNAPQEAAFRTLYNVPAGVPIFGPYGGKLVNSSETIVLYRPDAVQLPPKPDAGYVPQIFMEKVKYEDSAPWPTNADGGGVSLQRLSLTGYANDHTNWFSAPPTAGRTNILPAQVYAMEASSNGAFKLSVVTTPGRAYVVEGTTNILSGVWAVVTNFTAVGTNSMVTNYGTIPAFPYRFYRARAK